MASHETGVLTLRIPVAESAKPRRVQITEGADGRTIEAQTTRRRSINHEVGLTDFGWSVPPEKTPCRSRRPTGGPRLTLRADNASADLAPVVLALPHRWQSATSLGT